MRLLIVSLAVLFAVATQAGGDAPPPDAWPKTVEGLGAALAENDAGALLAVLSDDVAITTFESKNGDAIRLLARTKRASLIASLNYVYAPETMANDVAEACKNAEVPEEVKRKLAMRDDVHARRANRTAVTWLGETLAAKQGDKVGVLVFWCDKTANADAELVFILAKGDSESQFGKVKAICFGNPLPRAK